MCRVVAMKALIFGLPVITTLLATRLPLLQSLIREVGSRLR
jgi:hypothetical protein